MDANGTEPTPPTVGAPPEGLYEALVTHRVAARADGGATRAEIGPLDPAEAPHVLSRHLARLVEARLEEIEDPAGRLRLCERVLEALRDAGGDPDDLRGAAIDPPARLLLSLRPPLGALEADRPSERPGVPLAQNALLVNARAEHRIGSELARELGSADRVDLLCSFLKWSGWRTLESAVRAHLLRRPRSLRVATTCYLGATDRAVLDALVGLGAEVKVSYDTRRTRLHAKAWLFTRASGFSTAYVGSSNLSHAALHEGLEWNVRLSAIESPSVLRRIEATFDATWADPEFEAYDPARDAERFDRASARERPDARIAIVGLEIRPWPFQVEILDRLRSEREQHGRWRNLVVSATGTGKTIVAALDYARLGDEIAPGRLLFVAHRQEILEQSLARFREVLRDGAFGELFVGGARPVRGTHVFASIQSLAHVDLSTLAPEAYDMVIFDEIHHGASPTYERLLAHLRPKVLLGLTATPERADGQSILPWFDGRIAAELRLWEALERGLLSPFQYFGVADGTDLTAIRWTRGRYDRLALERLYTGLHARVRLVVAALKKRVLDPLRMRAIGFCVSVDHAWFMAAQFREHGIPATAIDAASSEEERAAALRGLRDRTFNVVFAVDLLNEGVDVPEVDTVLFLRPTESATVFLQQLGRGLRLCDDKDGLTVLDFVGRQATGFRFDLRFRALVGGSKADLARQVEQGFPRLPSGCSIELDPVAQRTVLENVRAALRISTRTLVDELRTTGPGTTLASFLAGAGLEPEDLYRTNRSFTSLRRAAGHLGGLPPPSEGRVLRALPRLLHLDDPVQLSWMGAGLGDLALLARDTPVDRRRLELFLGTLSGRDAVPGGALAFLEDLRQAPAARAELAELTEVLKDRLAHVPPAGAPYPDVPLLPHCTYAQSEILAAFGRATVERPYPLMAGVLFDEPHGCDLLFVTLQKAETDYSPTTMYRDYAISPDLFHWESQNMTRADSETGRRYRFHRERGKRVFLFVRAARGDAEHRGTAAYTFLGDAEYVRHEGEKPMAITWHLRTPMPAEFFAETAVKVG